MKNLFTNQQFQLDEILFQSRNKAYGAYILRNEYDQMLTKAMFLGIGLVVTLTVIPLVIEAFKTNDKTVMTSPPFIELKNVDDNRVIELVVKELVAATVKKEKTFDSSVPTPATNPKVEKPAPNINQYNDAVAGTENIIGENPIVDYQLPVIQVAVPKLPEVASKPSMKSTNTIVETVDVEASFQGGIDNFRNQLIAKFDISNFEGNGEILKATVTFIVERDGSISNVKVSGSDVHFNKEAERAIKNVEGKWTPAKLDGKSVRSYFRFPVSMKFE